MGRGWLSCPGIVAGPRGPVREHKPMSKKPSQVAQVLDGIPVTLKSGKVVVCQPPSVKAARRLMPAYNRVIAPPLPDDAPAAAITADEAERRAALQLLLDEFPAAVGQAQALEDGLAPWDIVRLLPGFFLKGTGARPSPIPPASPAPPRTPSAG